MSKYIDPKTWKMLASYSAVIPDGFIVLDWDGLRVGDQVFGARVVRTPRDHWTVWSGSILTQVRTNVLKSEVRIEMTEYPQSKTKWASTYQHDVEFLVNRPDRETITKTETASRDSHYPHLCPRCGGRAYVSIFNHVDCKNKCGAT